jgi:hypothetical protein
MNARFASAAYDTQQRSREQLSHSTGEREKFHSISLAKDGLFRRPRKA